LPVIGFWLLVVGTNDGGGATVTGKTGRGGAGIVGTLLVARSTLGGGGGGGVLPGTGELVGVIGVEFCGSNKAIVI